MRGLAGATLALFAVAILFALAAVILQSGTEGRGKCDSIENRVYLSFECGPPPI